eukprot:6921604-Pyramimonas_sp.AAC.1
MDAGWNESLTCRDSLYSACRWSRLSVAVAVARRGFSAVSAPLLSFFPSFSLPSVDCAAARPDSLAGLCPTPSPPAKPPGGERISKILVQKR